MIYMELNGKKYKYFEESGTMKSNWKENILSDDKLGPEFEKITTKITERR